MKKITERKGTASQIWTLKVLSGVHAGAEARLADEEATIGSNDDCDLVLDDAEFGEHHISLNVRDADLRLSVAELDKPVFINGRQVENSAEIEPYQVVSIGVSSFALGPADQEWPDITVGLPQRSDQHGSTDQAHPDDTPEGRSNRSKVNGAKTRVDGNRVAQPGKSALKIRPSMLSAVSASLVLLTSIGVIWLLMPTQTVQTRASPAAASDRMLAIAKRHGAVIDVQSEGEDGTRFSLTGSIDTAQGRQRFLAELASTGIHATANITSSEELARGIFPILDQTLNSNRRNNVVVRPVENAPGTLLITGYVESDADLLSTKAMLKRDANEHVRLRYDIQTKPDRLKILRRRLDELGLVHELQVQHLEDAISLYGPAPLNGKMADLIELTKNFNEEFESRPMLRLTGNDRYLGQSTIELDIRAVVLGDRVHVVMHDGESYAEGSTLDNGYRIKRIDQNYILLEKPHPLATQEGSEDATTLAYFIFNRQ